MKLKPFYIETKGLSDEQIAAVFDKAVQQGARAYDGVDWINDDYIVTYDPVGFRYFGVDGENDTFFNDSRRTFGPDAVKLSIDQVDEHLGLTEIQTETPEEKEALDAIRAKLVERGVSVEKVMTDIKHKSTYTGVDGQLFEQVEFGETLSVVDGDILIDSDLYFALSSKNIVPISDVTGRDLIMNRHKICKPVETPEQRNEREIEDLLDYACEELFGDSIRNCRPDVAATVRCMIEAGYRKEKKND